MYERSINRKIKEAYYSVILESKLNKDQILEAYLNTIYFGCGNGIQTAAQAYFSKDVDELTIAEAAGPCRYASETFGLCSCSYGIIF